LPWNDLNIHVAKLGRFALFGMIRPSFAGNAFRVMQADVEMFGGAAFTREAREKQKADYPGST
jgi:hypothetical protein